MSNTTHELKILPEWYESLASGLKTFEVRKDDRTPKFAPGDKLFLREFDGVKYTGRTETADVTLVLRNEYCREGYCIMSLSNIRVGGVPVTYAPVVHGAWKNNSDDYPACTRCGYMPPYDHHIDDIYYSPYCPSCGAKMKGEQNDK